MSLVGFLPVHLQGFYGWLIIYIYIYICNVTTLAPTHVNFLLTISFLAGDQLVAEGVTHISCHHKNTIEGAGGNRRTNEQTRTMLGVNSEQKEDMQHYMHVQTNASVGY